MGFSVRALSAIICNCSGHIMPFASKIALPCGFLAGFMKFVEHNDLWGARSFLQQWHVSAAGLTSFTASLSFLIIFRTSQSYARYWEGCALLQKMTGSFYDAASNIFAFVKTSKADSEEIEKFTGTCVSLFSMLNAMCLLEMSGKSDNVPAHRLSTLNILGANHLDEETLKSLRECENKTALIFHWIQSLLVEAMGSGVISAPPPIASRAFQEMSAGIVFFEDARKLEAYPFPFPYTQATLWFLIIHWILTPFSACTWTQRPSLAFLFTFAAVFIMWVLFGISQELESPYGDDDNDLDLVEIQDGINEQLCLLATPAAKKTPYLRSSTSKFAGFAPDDRSTLRLIFPNVPGLQWGSSGAGVERGLEAQGPFPHVDPGLAEQGGVGAARCEREGTGPLEIERSATRSLGLASAGEASLVRSHSRSLLRCGRRYALDTPGATPRHTSRKNSHALGAPRRYSHDASRRKYSRDLSGRAYSYDASRAHSRGDPAAAASGSASNGGSMDSGLDELHEVDRAPLLGAPHLQVLASPPRARTVSGVSARAAVCPQEAEHQAKEQERKALVGAFFKEHGYSDVGCPKRTMTKTKYPIKTAAKIGDSKVVAALQK